MTATGSSSEHQDAGTVDEDLAEELRLARLEINALRSELAAAQPAIVDLELRLVASQQQSERYRLQIEELRMSSSWKVTKPLRMLSRRNPAI